MPEDYFSDASEAQESAPSSRREGPAEKQGGEEEHDPGETTIIPKSMLAGHDFEPGDTLMLRVERISDDGAVECSYETRSDEEIDEEKEGGGEAKAKPPSEMASLME